MYIFKYSLIIHCFFNSIKIADFTAHLSAYLVCDLHTDITCQWVTRRPCFWLPVILLISVSFDQF